MKRTILQYKSKEQALNRYNNYEPVIESVTPPAKVVLADGTEVWQVEITKWSLD